MVDFTDRTDIIARTLWGEARGCGMAGMQRIANVICNRVLHKRWWGHDFLSVCLDPWQFATWNARQPRQHEDGNFRAVMAVTADDPWFLIALKLAEQAPIGTLEDLSLGADTYYAIRTPAPVWTMRAVRRTADGWHSFWSIILPSDTVTGLADARNVGISTYFGGGAG